MNYVNYFYFYCCRWFLLFFCFFFFVFVHCIFLSRYWWSRQFALPLRAACACGCSSVYGCMCVWVLVRWSAAFGISIWLMLTCRSLSTEKNPLIHPYPFLVRLATESMLARSLALSLSISSLPYAAISLWPGCNFLFLICIICTLFFQCIDVCDSQCVCLFMQSGPCV